MDPLLEHQYNQLDHPLIPLRPHLNDLNEVEPLLHLIPLEAYKHLILEHPLQISWEHAMLLRDSINRWAKRLSDRVI